MSLSSFPCTETLLPTWEWALFVPPERGIPQRANGTTSTETRPPFAHVVTIFAVKSGHIRRLKQLIANPSEGVRHSPQWELEARVI